MICNFIQGNGFLCSILFVCIILSRLKNNLVESHGRLMEPPARNSMWRFGYPNPVDYNDNELYCGGYSMQWLQNGGKCGVCGDPWHFKPPRPHEAGGEFGQGIISRHYFAGQVIDIVVELTSNHHGRFELYLCPNNNPKQEATQSCFDRHPLYVEDTKEVRYFIPQNSSKKETFSYKVRLPSYLTCSQCVLQWTYYTGNMWGTCDNGTEALGCGHPETFRNCADLRIVSSSSSVPPQFVNTLDFTDMSRKFNSKGGTALSYPNVVNRKKKKGKITKKDRGNVTFNNITLKKKKVIRKKRLLKPKGRRRTRVKAEESSSPFITTKTSRAPQQFGIRLNKRRNRNKQFRK